MKHIGTQTYKTKTAQSSGFTPEETRSTRLHNIWEGAKGVGKKAIPPVWSGAKNIWNALDYMGRGYLPFDVIRETKRTWGQYDDPSNLDRFKDALKESVDVPVEDIKYKELQNLFHHDEAKRAVAFNELKKITDLDDNKLSKILEKWINKRENHGFTDEL